MTAHPDPSDSEFLQQMALRLRTLRARRGVTRRDLARRSGISERYIAQLEAGSGNVSVLLLRRIARTLGIAPDALLSGRDERSAERLLVDQMLERLSDADLTTARALLQRHFGRKEAASRHRRIALIGLRGAGKSTLGAQLAARIEARFVELDREVEHEARMRVADIFALQGQDAYRRLERAALLRLVQAEERVVIAAAGGIIADSVTYELLLETCFTVWLRASPEEHMRRVAAQGDMRPMGENIARAMDDLRAILESREALYAQADITLDTTGRPEAECLSALLAALPVGLPAQ